MRLSIITLFCIFFILKSLGFAQKMGGEEEGAARSEEMVQEEQRKGEAAGEEGKKGAAEAKVPAVTSVLEIKRLDTAEPLYSFELKDVDLSDVFRVLAHDYKLNLLVDKDVQGKITASFSNITLEEAIEEIANSQNLILEKKKNIIAVLPNLVTKVFALKYIEAKKLLEGTSGGTNGGESGGQTGGAGAGSQAQGAESGKQSEGKGAAGGPGMASATQTGSSGEVGQAGGSTSSKKANTIFDLLSEKGKILLGSMPNSIMVIDYPPNIAKVEAYIKEIDKKMSVQVFKMKYLKASEILGQTSTSSAASTSVSGAKTSAGESTGGGE